MQAERKITNLSVNTLLLYIPLLALTDRQNHRQRNEYTYCTWAGGTFFHCLRKVSPDHQRSAGVWYIVQEFGW
jgi:hypothetical protein